MERTMLAMCGCMALGILQKRWKGAAKHRVKYSSRGSIHFAG
ncbi:hypothetical protein HDF19_07560 [Mucilaginibacter sp. E4BP6]|nr:hypothetical protein [Mucilaginibacter sp. E4BP6]